MRIVQDDDDDDDEAFFGESEGTLAIFALELERDPCEEELII